MQRLLLKGYPMNKPTGLKLAERLQAKAKQAKHPYLVPQMGYERIPRIPTGSLLFDRALGGGLPVGRIVNFWGAESTGKSTMALVCAGAVIRSGGNSGAPGEGMVAYVDVENTFDLTWAYRVGVTNPDNLHVFRPYSGEAALDLIRDLARETWADDAGVLHGVYDLIILDSLGMMYWKEEEAGSANDAHVGLGARKFSAWVRPLQADLARYGTTLLTLNHVTMKIGVNFGDPETQPGGKKLRHANSIEVYFSTPRRVPSGIDKPIEGYVFNARARKNKTAIAKRKADVFIRVTDDNFGPQIIPELSGWTDKTAGYSGSFPGLLKEFGLLCNADGGQYNSGYMFYQTHAGDMSKVEPLMTRFDRQAKSKADLEEALSLDPDLRSWLIMQVHDAIAYENSYEGIQQMIADGTVPHDDLTLDVDGETEQPDQELDGSDEPDPWFPEDTAPADDMQENFG